MIDWIQLLVFSALFGSALIGGIFYTFSSFVMKGLEEITPPEGIRAMQSINRTVINPLVMGPFFGTAILSLILSVLVLTSWGGALSHWHFVGALLYFFGTFLLTAFGNVPLNEKLDTTDPKTGADFWAHYLKRWNLFNHIRTVAALLAAACFLIGLL